MTKSLFTLVTLVFGFNANSAYEVPGFAGDAGMYEMKADMYQMDRDVFMSFTLPTALTGEVNKVRAKGKMISDDSAVLVSDNAVIECTFSKLICQARYSGLNIDITKVEENLRAQGVDFEELDSRLEVSRRFEGDPIGVFSFSLFKM